jgi:hypothetical protein
MARASSATSSDAATVDGRRSTVIGRLFNRPLLLLIAIFVLLAPLATRRIYASDEIKYYAYTHSLFFDGDLDFGNDYLHWYEVDPVKFEKIKTDLYETREPLTGLPTNEAPIGTGLLWMPSYVLAHVYSLAAQALGFDVEADGWSDPYIAAICLTSYLFGCLGLLLCWSIARTYFGRRLAAFGVVVVWFSTSLIFYTVIAPPWSHATSLLVVTLFIWYWHRTRLREGQARTLVQWGILGALGGLMMLVREQDALFFAIPGVEALVALVAIWRGRSADWARRAARLTLGFGVMLVAALVAFIPQLIAYRVITGRFGPSQVVAGKFTFTSPNFFNVLFNPEHGLVLWTPVVAVCLGGMLLFWRRDRLFAGALMLAFLFQVYIAGSFLTWQSASSFGQRRFINCTLIFVLGACALIAWAMSRGVPRWAIAGVGALFVFWNAGLLMQYALWCSPQRQGLDWAMVLKGQIEIPLKAPGLVWDFLFNRPRFYRSLPLC